MLSTFLPWSILPILERLDYSEGRLTLRLKDLDLGGVRFTSGELRLGPGSSASGRPPAQPPWAWTESGRWAPSLDVVAAAPVKPAPHGLAHAAVRASGRSR